MNIEVGQTDNLDACFQIRRVVFIDEQNVPEEIEMDAYDQTATHLLALLDGKPVGTARILYQGDMAKLGRIAVLKASRGLKVGAALTQKAIDIARDAGAKSVRLSAQVYAIGFYEKLGFVAEGPIYQEAGIDHRDMGLAL